MMIFPLMICAASPHRSSTENKSVLSHGEGHDGFLYVQAVFRFVINHGVRAVDDFICDFDVAVSGERVHVDGIFFGQLHAALVGDPAGILLDDLGALFFIRGVNHRAPGFGVNDVGVLEAGIHVIHNLEAGAELARLFARLVHDLGHQLEFGRVSQDHIQAEAGHLEDQALRHRHGFLIGGGVSPRNDHLFAAQVAALLLPNGEQVGQALEGMVDVALHVEHGDA